MKIKTELKVLLLRYKQYRQREKQKKALKRAIKIADDRKLISGKKQVVMLDYDGSFAVFTRDEFLLMRRRGRFGKKVNWSTVCNRANYLTK